MKTSVGVILVIFLVGCFYISSSRFSEAQLLSKAEAELPSSTMDTWARSVVERVKDRYAGLSSFRAKGTNWYTRKGFGNELTNERQIKIDYSSPSEIRVELNEGENFKVLRSTDSGAILDVNQGEKILTYDDIYWGLTSIEFGDGSFFEVGKLLVLKERGRGNISSLDNLVAPRIVGEETVKGKLCYKLQAGVKSNDQTLLTYWIEKDSSLIVRFENFSPARKIEGGFFRTLEEYDNEDFQ